MEETLRCGFFHLLTLLYTQLVLGQEVALCINKGYNCTLTRLQTCDVRNPSQFNVKRDTYITAWFPSADSTGLVATATVLADRAVSSAQYEFHQNIFHVKVDLTRKDV